MAERKVFIAIDGSKPSNTAFQWYMDNMMRAGDKIYLVHASESKVDIGLPGAAIDQAKLEQIIKATKEEQDRIDILCNAHTEAIRQKGVAVTTATAVCQGEKPGPAIIKKAEEEGANVIVMGSRGLGTIRRTLMGSVSEYVLHHAPPMVAVTVLRDQ